MEEGAEGDTGPGEDTRSVPGSKGRPAVAVASRNGCLTFLPQGAWPRGEDPSYLPLADEDTCRSWRGLCGKAVPAREPSGAFCDIPSSRVTVVLS